MSIKPTSIPSKRLAASITSSSYTFQLNNILSWDGVTSLTSADFGTLAYGAFRNDTNTAIEFFAFDPSTIASGSITIIYRGLKFTGDYTTEVTANKLTWIKNQTIVEIGADVPQLLNHFIFDTGNQSIDGVKTFTSSPTIPLTPVASTDAASKGYIDGIAIAGSPNASTIVKGIGQVSVAPASPTTPIFVGDNDTRVPTIAQTVALAGDDSSIPVGSGNKVVTQTGFQIGSETYIATTGAANTYLATFSPSPVTLTAGMQVKLLASFANTGAAFLAVAGTKSTIGTATMTIASPCVVSFTSHGLVAGDIIQFTTTGALPTGLAVSTNYYVISAGLTTNAFELSLTLGGSAINTTGSQSGIHTLYRVTKNITKISATALVANDILSSQLITLVYDGTQWQLQSPIGNVLTTPVYKNGVTTRTGNTASGSQTIAHGLGVIPKYIRLTARKGVNAVSGTGAKADVQSVGVYNGTTTSSVWSDYVTTSSTGTIEANTGTDTSNIIYIRDSSAGGESQGASVAFDATNITLTWTKSASPTSDTINILWEAFA